MCSPSSTRTVQLLKKSKEKRNAASSDLSWHSIMLALSLLKLWILIGHCSCQSLSSWVRSQYLGQLCCNSDHEGSITLVIYCWDISSGWESTIRVMIIIKPHCEAESRAHTNRGGMLMIVTAVAEHLRAETPGSLLWRCEEALRHSKGGLWANYHISHFSVSLWCHM